MSVEGGTDKHEGTSHSSVDLHHFDVQAAIEEMIDDSQTELSQRTVIPMNQCTTPDDSPQIQMLRGSDFYYQRSSSNYTNNEGSADIIKRIDQQKVCNFMGSFAGDNNGAAAHQQQQVIIQEKVPILKLDTIRFA